MGEVYKARDTRLDRLVAVKVLTERLSGNATAMERFEREAKAVAALSHPNILSIFDFGHEGDVTYAVMELLEGETLRERLARGPLPVSKVAEMAGQIVEGLAAAHEKGIVHRDLKPGNLFITKAGRIKILDFGLAKLTSQEAAEGEPLSQMPTGAAHTSAGTVLGTMGYMAPEQARGLPADARSDIFAFGCVLYEMLSGQRPFGGDTASDMLVALLSKDPDPLPPVTPPGLDRIVRRCLEKRPEDRFQSAHDVGFALEAVSGSGAPPPSAAPAPMAHLLSPALLESSPWQVVPPQRLRGPLRARWIALSCLAVILATGVVFVGYRRERSAQRAGDPSKIVVFPFENLGPKDEAYFAAGMTEEIASRLANVSGLGVISRNTAVQYNRAGKTTKQIGRDLGVDYVLEGSVQWGRGPGQASRVRITPQLIRVEDDTQVWSDRYDRVMADVFAIQSEVAESAVKAMGLTLLPRERARLKEVATDDLEAYDLYLRGQEASQRGNRQEDFEEALRLFQTAVDRDRNFAQAWAGIAENELRMYWFYYDRSDERLSRAKEAANRAVALRPDLPEARSALGFYFYHGRRDYPRALIEFEAALKIQPENSHALMGMGSALLRGGRWDEGADALIKARGLDPRNGQVLAQCILAFALARRYADADRTLDQAIAIAPQTMTLHAMKAYLRIIWRGDLDGALSILENARRIPGLMASTERTETIVEFMALIDRRDYTRALDLMAVERVSEFDNQYLYLPVSLLRAQALALSGQRAAALNSYETARGELERKVKQDPEDSRVHSALGIACAGLGRRAEALREARRGCELMPVSKDAWLARFRLNDLVLVCTMVGRPEEAIGQLDALLSACGWFTSPLYRLDPRFDPLKAEPGFEALLNRHEAKP